MNKYIDAERLIAEIERRKKELFEVGGDIFENKWACGSLDNIKAFVISHQQEQQEPSNNLVDVDAVREDFITEVYRVLDADPTNDRANAIIDAFDSLPTVSQEQPEVELEKEIENYAKSYNENGINFWDWEHTDDAYSDMIRGLARHFYELGLNARKDETK